MSDKKKEQCLCEENTSSLMELDYSIEDEVYGEARYSWYLGKRLRLYAENEEEVVKALVDAHGGKEAEGKYTRSRGKKRHNKEN